MSKRSIRLWSSIMALVLIFNMLPLKAMAVNTGSNPNETSGGSHETQNSLSHSNSDLDILEEVIEKRSEYSKEFIMSNGLHMAAVYDVPVHFLADGQWQEIDNTLKLSNNRSENVYTNSAGSWQVLMPQNMTRSNGISILKDGYTLNFRMSGEIHTISGNHQVMANGDDSSDSHAESDEENDLFSSNTAEGYVNEIDILDAIQAGQEYSLSQPVEEAVAVVIDTDDGYLLAEGEYEESFVKNLYSRLEYADVYNNTDIIFELTSNMVKETILIRERDESVYGYTYLLDVGEMIPVLSDDNVIELYDTDRKNLIMAMPAPFLIDAAGVCCYDVDVCLNETNGLYILSYILPQEWLADEQREWPVILDPAVQPSLNVNNIRDRTVSSSGGYSSEAGSLLCGYYSSTRVCRSYVKYWNLPALTSADMIVSANMSMYAFDANYNDGKSIPVVEVHKVKGVWESQTIGWDNKPDYDPTVEDYAVVSEKEAYYNWEVTDLVREWYEGQNTGMMFKMPDSVEAASDVYAQFFSSDFSIYQVYEKPTLTILFRNNNGVEGYWDYTASSAGRAGTGYVNQYTGNLVWTRSDIGFGGNRMPVTISHIYNANDRAENQFGMGYGWRTNFNQQVYRWNHQNAYGDYYVWEDADGTDHYFYYESAGTYKDEDGLELTLTTTGSGNEKYRITDKYGNASYFDTNGRLTKQSNNQETKSEITIAYTTASGKLISTISDGAGRVYSFTYTNNLLSKIAYKGKGTSEITYVNFGYTNSNLTSVTDKDEKTSNYTYTTNNLLATAQDIDGYKICYEYTTTTAGQPNRIKTITEYSGADVGGVLNIEYAHNQTKFTDYNGNVQIVQFNNMGNTISIQDNQGRAQYAQYAINDPTSSETTARSASAKGNQLLLASKLQNTVGNVLKNSSFESEAPWTATSSAVTCEIDSGYAYMGSNSLKMVRTSSGDAAGVYSTEFSVAGGETYTFSAYVKTGAGSAYLALNDGSDPSESETLASGSGWTRLEVSYTNTSSAAKSVTARLMTEEAGTTYMDCVQIEKAPTASRYNLIENGDFAYGDDVWNTNAGRIAVTADNKAPAPQLDVNVYMMTGNPTGENRISQTVTVSGTEGDTFVLAGWAKADSVPIRDDREFAMIATFMNGSDIVNTSTVRFNYCADSTIEWQYAASPIVADGAYTSIKIELAYDYNANTVCFDGIQLYKEEFGNSYTYDENGNIISVKDVQGQTTSYEYENNNLAAQVLPSGARLEYEYDEWHNVKTATTDTGVVYNFTYDKYGNNTSVSIISGSVKLTSSAAYIDDGKRLVSTTDAAGKVTTYSYNADTNVLEWVQYPEDTAETRTEYTYDTMYRLAKAEAEVSTGSSLSAQYGYTNDLLTSITTGSTLYSFTYGAFALRSNIKIGSRTLASYTYTPRNNFLDTLEYGNNDSVKYTYDKLGRVTQQAYEDGDTVTYKYDNNGALATVTDSATGITTTYYYDFSDRLLRYAEEGTDYSHIVGYEYDEINNLTALVETINGTQRATTYAYDDDNRVTSVTTGNTTSAYTYDAYSRVSQQQTSSGSGTILTETYAYRNPTGTTTTGQVSSLTIDAAHFDAVYTYTYDDNGNILSVSDGTNTTSYVYDSANQLTRENNQAVGKTWVWAYDNAGNILSRTEYAYTAGELGAVVDTIAYTYGDSDWGDLLTAYDGQAITYDEIGNPLTVKDSTGNVVTSYTWEHGRQLASLTANDQTWHYTYNADGLRTKRTNGSITYSYVYNGSQLSAMTRTYNGTTNQLVFTYDASGSPVSVTMNGEVFYYVTNLQGDVVALLDEDSYEVGSYEYTAYGNVSITMGHPVVLLNPLLYRGYVHDLETGLYYLQSRYYNPNLGRFLNADALVSTGQGILGNNMFAYCLNDPVNYCDPSGNFAGDLTGNGGASSGNTGAGYGGGGIFIPCPVPLSIDDLDEYARNIREWVEAQPGIKKYQGHSVYVLKDPNDHYLVKYVGRTNDPGRREQEHKHDPVHPWREGYVMTVVKSGLTLEQAIAWEQVTISAYTLRYLENARREIAVKNVPKFQSYINAITEIFTGIPRSDIIDFMSRR